MIISVKLNTPMKHLLSLITLLTLTTHAFSQGDSTNVPFVSYWSIGDSYDFKITNTKQTWKKGELSTDEKQEYIANFTVIDSTPSSYTINWSYENDLSSMYNIPDNLMEKFSQYELTEIIYTTSEYGDFIEILNWAEIGTVMNNMFDDIIEYLGDNDEKKQDALRKAMQPFKDVYSSKEGIEQIVLIDLQYFHFFLGAEYDVTEPIIYDDEVPNLFGGKPIKAKSKIIFESIDFDESFCVIRQEMSLDPEGTKEFIEDVFKQMKLGSKEIKKAFKTAKMQVEDRNVYEIYYYPGIPRKIETEREVIIKIENVEVNTIAKTVILLMYDD
jgi:hypothetical protein